MKKALFAISTALSSVALAAAQITGQITIPIGGNGGTIQVGQTGQSGQVNGSQLFQLLDVAQNLVNRLVPFMIGLAVVSFFWFLVRFIMKSGDPNGRTDSLKGMGYSMLALFLMVSVWGIIILAASMLGVGVGGNIPIPGVPRPS